MPLIKYKVNGVDKFAILSGLNGEVVNKQVLNKIGMPVSIKGKLKQMDNWNILYFNKENGITVKKKFE